MQIILYDDHGDEHDVTEHVRSLYGHTTGSMDWGSGFLDTDEMLEVQEFGYLSGFEDGDVQQSIEYHEQSLSNLREWSKLPNRATAYDKNIADQEKWIAGLQAIRDARVQLFKQTDDVTNFDEEN